MRATRVVALLISTGLGVMGCSSSGDDGGEPKPTDDVGGTSVTASASADATQPVESGAAPTLVVEGANPGDWVFEEDGVTGVVRKVSAEDPEVAELEEYRQTVDGPEATYFAVDIDNTGGSGEFGAGRLTVVDAQARQIDVDPAEQYISELQDLPPAADDASVYNIGVDLSNGKYANDFTVAGAKRTEYLATSEALADLTAVTYTPYMGSPIEAHSYE